MKNLNLLFTFAVIMVLVFLFTKVVQVIPKNIGIGIEIIMGFAMLIVMFVDTIQVKRRFRN